MEKKYIRYILIHEKNIKKLDDISKKQEKEILIGTTFELGKKLSLKELLALIKEKLQINQSLPYVLPDEIDIDKKFIKKIGVCSGSGADYIKKIDTNKIDIYLTGDIKYHDALDSKYNLKLPLIDVTHFYSEKIFGGIIKTEFKKTFKDNLEIIVSDVEKNPINI